MTACLSNTVRFWCASCGREGVTVAWTVFDVTERPELLEELDEVGSADCECGGSASRRESMLITNFTASAGVVIASADAYSIGDLPVNGQQDLPTGGHGFSPWTATGIPHGRPGGSPAVKG